MPKADVSDSLARRLGDLAATQSTYLVAVVSFYGTWKSQDNYFDDLEDPLGDKIRNAAVTAVSLPTEAAQAKKAD